MRLHDEFRSPSAAYRQAPFWFWNHDLDLETLAWQIDQMAQKGLGGFVMHARHGLITPYLSDTWFECIRFCCARAREHGMIPWAYDECDWPSGPAGGTVIADGANRLHYLRLDEESIQGPCRVEKGEDTAAWYIQHPGAAELERQETDAAELSEGTGRVVRAVQIECPAILWFESYLDTLDAEACAAFRRSTYDKHEEVLGNLAELGLAGFFTDEPALSTYPDDLRRFPWTASLPEAFRKDKGYDLLDRLPDMLVPGDQGAQVRYDYWDTATTLFERAFFAPLGNWCRERGLQFIGHPLGEEPLFYQFRCLGNIFRHLRHLDMPGMDHVTGDLPIDQPTGIVPKLVSSAALLAGRDRVMTETFGESGWRLSLRDMKAMADWQIVQGVNYFIPHAFYYSIAQRRKKDSPPSEFYQAPYWPYYRLFADYTARVTAATTGGEAVAKIAVLFPMSSVWADFVPGAEGPGEAVQALEDAFAPLCKSLLDLHRDFVVVDETSFAEAAVGGARFKINDLPFDALVVPPLTSIRDDALAAVRNVAGAALVVAVGSEGARVLAAGAGEPPDAVQWAEIDGVRCVPGGDAQALAEALTGVVPDVIIDNTPSVHYLHRRKEGKDLYFFANIASEEARADVSLDTVGLAEIWDPGTGDKSHAPGQHVADGRLVVPLTLPPSGSCLVVVDTAQDVQEVPVVEFIAGRRMKLCHLWEFTPENGNLFPLRQWELNVETRHKCTELKYTSSFVLTDRIGNLRLIVDGIPEHPYNMAEAARAIVGHETQASIRLNGDEITEELPWEIDAKFRVLDLSDYSDPGTHRLDITVKNHGWFPQPGLQEYAWLAGDFTLEPDQGGLPHLVAARGLRSGPWEKQGFPYFSGMGTYAAEFVAPDDIEGKRTFIDAGRVGDLIEVEVNGQTLGVAAWAPYRIETTGVMHPGNNIVVLKVTNTAHNLIEGPDDRSPSGLLEDVWFEIAE